MNQIEGQQGHLTFYDSYIEFDNWIIDENLPNNPSQSYWSGSFRIQGSDYRGVLNLWVSNLQIKAEFQENHLKHNGKIMIVFPRDVHIRFKSFQYNYSFLRNGEPDIKTVAILEIGNGMRMTMGFDTLRSPFA